MIAISSLRCQKPGSAVVRCAPEAAGRTGAQGPLRAAHRLFGGSAGLTLPTLAAFERAAAKDSNAAEVDGPLRVVNYRKRPVVFGFNRNLP